MLPCILTNSCIHLWSKHGFICRVVRDFFECWIKMHTGLNIFLKQTTTENDQASEQRHLNTFDSTGFPQRFRLWMWPARFLFTFTATSGAEFRRAKVIILADFKGWRCATESGSTFCGLVRDSDSFSESESLPYETRPLSVAAILDVVGLSSAGPQRWRFVSKMSYFEK